MPFLASSYKCLSTTRWDSTGDIFKNQWYMHEGYNQRGIWITPGMFLREKRAKYRWVSKEDWKEWFEVKEELWENCVMGKRKKRVLKRDSLTRVWQREGQNGRIKQGIQEACNIKPTGIEFGQCNFSIYHVFPFGKSYCLCLVQELFIKQDVWLLYSHTMHMWKSSK